MYYSPNLLKYWEYTKWTGDDGSKENDILRFTSNFPNRKSFEYNIPMTIPFQKMPGYKSWSSYHSRKDRVSIKSTPTPCNCSILPLLKDVMHTPEMHCHLMKLCIDYTRTQNPQQVTAGDCPDQPIYALSKIIQAISRVLVSILLRSVSKSFSI